MKFKKGQKVYVWFMGAYHHATYETAGVKGEHFVTINAAMNCRIINDEIQAMNW